MHVYSNLCLPGGRPHHATGTGKRHCKGRGPMSLLLSDADVRQAVNYTELADGIETALKVQAEAAAIVPARMNLERAASWLRVMPAVVPSANVMGLKVFHGVAGTAPRYLTLLYSISDGAL